MLEEDNSLRKITHDLNNQLATMRMSVEISLRKKPDPELEKTLTTLQQCIVRCIESVRKIEKIGPES